MNCGVSFSDPICTVLVYRVSNGLSWSLIKGISGAPKKGWGAHKKQSLDMDHSSKDTLDALRPHAPINYPTLKIFYKFVSRKKQGS